MSMIFSCKQNDCKYIQRSELTKAYIDDIKKFPVLSGNEELKLLKRAKSDNPVIAQAAKNKLVECNQRFVLSIAKRWQRGDNLLDIVNEGNIGLLQAIDHYDIEKKQRFITYAVYWIRKSINDYIILKDKPVVPANAVKIHTYLPKIKNSFFLEHQRYPTFEEIKKLLKEKYNVMVKYSQDLEALSLCYIDDAYFESRDTSLNSNIYLYDEITSTNNVKEDTDETDRKKMVEALLSILTPREKEVVCKYYGIGCFEMGLDTLCTDMRMSRERARQILKSAMLKMKKHKNFISNI